MRIKLFLLGCGLGLSVATSGLAVTTGTINAKLVLTAGCLVNGLPAVTNANFGTLDFGTSVATFDALNASVTGSQGAGIYVRCTTGESYNIQLTNSNAAPATVFGTVTSTGARYLIRSSDATLGIAYTLYPSTLSTTPIVNNSNLTANGTADPIYGDNYQIFGRIVGGGNNAMIPVGTYVDVINVAVNY